MKNLPKTTSAKTAVQSKIETKIINFGDEKISFRFSVASVLLFFDLYGMDVRETKTMKDRINYFYCAHKAACNYEKTVCKFTENDFANLLDEYPHSFAATVQALASQG